MHRKKQFMFILLTSVCLMTVVTGCGSQENAPKEARAAQAEINKAIDSAPKVNQDLSKVPEAIKSLMMDGAQNTKWVAAPDPLNNQYDSFVKFDMKLSLTQVTDYYHKKLQQLGQKYTEESGSNFMQMNLQLDIYNILISIEKSSDIEDGASIKVAYHLNMQDPKAREQAEAQKVSPK
ncbi:hypothetical protein SAMN04487897_1653 [Paenibacillus sp. yr247]|uniref:hypothetical protein n=1 Tax=Paenibacillus sp. yr247 TaxID=1761880 RepID=UPI000886F0D9|nr:hypothetical protein [Paenibacillus sp. yr247]SDP28603.1 hypothetical protein SAMN04487897_1653 [Paenibacillus sp. yr247]